MLDSKEVKVEAAETNIYDVLAEAMKARTSLVNVYINFSGEAYISRAKEQLVLLDEHIKDFKAMAVDEYDPEEEA